MRLPFVINHMEISPTGGCRGLLVKDPPQGNLWICTKCEASYTYDDLDYLGGDFILRTVDYDRDSSDWEFDAELYY